MPEYLCRKICPLAESCADKVIREGNRTFFEKDVLRDGVVIGHISVSVRLKSNKTEHLVTPLVIDEKSVACTYLIGRLNFILEQGNEGMVLGGSFGCTYLKGSKLLDHWVNSYGKPTERSNRDNNKDNVLIKL
jgi:hypothetical protein